MQGKVDPRQFQLEKVLNNHDDRKSVALLGKLNNSTEPALLILEKKAFPGQEALAEVTSSFKTISQYFENDVFSRHSIITQGQVSEIDAQLVFPVPEKLIKKYTKKEMALLQETPEFYKKYTYPALVQGSESQNQWLYNILNKEAETENIVFDDPDPQNGFILLPDISFTKPDNLERFHLLAIVYRKDIRSLRELNETHLPLLLNIFKKTRETIKEKYGLDPNKVKAYVHYQPTYYHFHVHFCHVSMEGASLQFEKAHNFAGVIQNIKLKPTYYQEAMLEFLVEAESALYKQFMSESSAVQNFLEL